MNVSQKMSHKTNFRNKPDRTIDCKTSPQNKPTKGEMLNGSKCVCTCVEELGQLGAFSRVKCLRTLKRSTPSRLCRFVAQLHDVITCVTLSKPLNYSVNLFLNAWDGVSMVVVINNKLRHAQDTFPCTDCLINTSYFWSDIKNIWQLIGHGHQPIGIHDNLVYTSLIQTLII